MLIEKLDKQSQEIIVAIPLTKITGKTRIKKRSFFNQYGVPIAPKQTLITQDCYVEWQIGYDIDISDKKKLELTTIKDELFVGANNKEKTLYELSEYIFYFYKWGIITKDKLTDTKKFLSKLSDKDFIDNPDKFPIERSHPIEKDVLGINFFYTQVKYPLLVHKFGQYEILTEIKVAEKQRAVGVQPMLYFCVPITELCSEKPLLSRTATTKESAKFIINKQNISIFVEMLKIFGILSKNHNHDIIKIIDRILK